MWPFSRKDAAPASRKSASFYFSLAARKGGLTGAAYDKLSAEGYAESVVAFACINRIAWAVASVEPQLYQKKGRKLTKIEDHALIDLLEAPNKAQSGKEFMAWLAAFHQLSGNAYIFGNGIDPNRRTSNPPTELQLLNPGKVKVEKGTGYFPAAFEYRPDANTLKTYPVDQITGRSAVLQIKSFNPLNDWYGLSALEPGALGVDIHSGGQRWNKGLIENGARPSGALQVKDSEGKPSSLTDEQYARLKSMIDQQFSGTGNSGRPLLLEGGLEWQEMSLSPKDMDFLEGKHSAARDIALAFGVPPQLLGIPGDSTYCLPAFERVETEHGPVPIADVKIGTRVYSIDGSGQMVLKPVKTALKTGRKMVYRIETRNRVLYATDNHPILSRIDTFNGRHTESHLAYRQVKDLKTGDVIVQATKVSRGTNHEPNERLEFIGQYLGDGHALGSVKVADGLGYRRGSRVSLACVDGTPKANIYRDSLKRMVDSVGGRSTVGRSGRALHTACLPLYEYCDEAGILGTSKSKRLPTFAFSLNDEGKLAVIRGMVDSDGTVDKNGRASIILNNLDLVKDFWHLCLSAGLTVSKIRSHHRTSTLPNGEKFQCEIHEFMLPRAEDVLRIMPSTTQYVERARANCGKPIRSGEYTHGKEHYLSARAALPVDCCYGRVTSITPVEEMDVYDIEVEETHNFIASGIVVHNSNYSEAKLAFWTDTAIPALTLYLEALNRWLTPLYGEDLYLWYDEEMIPALEPLRKSKADRINAAAYLTIDEKRAAMGYGNYEPSSTPGGLILVQASNVPLELAGAMNISEPGSPADLADPNNAP